MKHTSQEDMDLALDRVTSRKETWSSLPLGKRIALAEKLNQSIIGQTEDWVAASLEAKGGEGRIEVEGQEWFAGPYCVLRNLRLIRETLQGLKKMGTPIIPGTPKKVGNGQVAVDVFPFHWHDKLFFRGTRAEIWMQPEVTEDNLTEHTAAAYGNQNPTPALCLVLGAGNVSSIGPMDCLYKLFNEKKCVILKMHPVNAYLGPIFEKAFAPLIEADFMALVYGDAAEGSYLCNHNLVDEIHITGSDKTHDIIVFGPNAAERKKERNPFLKKPITSELGNVSPVILVPGDWSPGELEFQAENLASSLANNGGFNCNASRVIVTHEDWPHRDAFLDALRKAFTKTQPRLAYYPGARDRFESFRKAHPKAESLGHGDGKVLPWLLVHGVDSGRKEDICFNTEAFCSVIAETTLPASSTREFIGNAVAFANNTLWGTLNATLIAHPNTLKDKLTAQAFEHAIADLRYGTVSVNHWAGIGYGLCSTTWGAYPGHDIYDIQSGLDVVHNSFMFEKPQKSVLRGPFKPWPKPPWFVTHKRGAAVGKKLTRFEAAPSLFKLPGIFMNALRG